VALLCAAPAAGAATRLVAPSGADSGNCSASPCRSLGYAYQQSAAGDVISIAAGQYPGQSVPAGTKAVTFSAASGVVMRQLGNEASNVIYEGIEIDAGGQKLLGFYNGDASHVTFRNGRIGNIVDEKGVMLGGWSSTASQHVVFDNVEFHDVLQVGADVHNECIYSQSPGLTVRNSTFRNCATMDLMITRGSWWDQPTYGGLTLENNVFGHSINGSGPRWHYYGFLVHGNMGQLTDARIVNNTFENAVGGVSNAEIGTASGVWANNIGSGWECLPGMTYRGNVGKKCDASDTGVASAALAATFLDPLSHDFRLKPGSAAIDVGSAEHAPARDRLGYRRDSRPDAGAYEFGAGPDSGAPAAPGGSGGPRSGAGTSAWRLRRARLASKVICHRPRRGCPRSTKLRLRLGRPARVAIVVQRLRKGRRPDRVRTLRRRQVGLHKALRIRAKGLRAGRYRIVVRATDATGLRSAPVRIKLRVR
jgi:hypothetical protein